MRRLVLGLRRFTSPVPGLVASLERELAYEGERHIVNEQISSFLARSGFQLSETPDSLQMKLWKRVAASLVEVHFQVKQHLPDETKGNSEEAKEAQKQEAVFHNFEFQVAVSFGPQALVFECFVDQNKWAITNASFTKDMSKFSQLGPEYRGQEMTAGPILDSATHYLESYGINEGLVSFLKTYAKEKERIFYMQWLQEARDFFARGVTLP